MTPRERVERLVAEETTAMVTRAVQKMAPRARAALVAAAAQGAGFIFRDAGRLRDAEVEACAGMTDDEIRESWRKTYEAGVTAMLVEAGEMPS